MNEQKNKRTAPSVQDVINGTGAGRARTKFKSGYAGPKRAIKSSAAPLTPPQAAGSIAVHRSGGILDYAWLAYSGVLAIAVATALIAYLVAGSGNKGGIYYPDNVFTITGVVKDIFADYRNGGLGTGYKPQAVTGSTVASQGTGMPSQGPEAGGPTDEASALLGESSASTAPNSTTGATMALDVGSASAKYPNATSYEELLTQLDTALAANDYEFAGSKLAYEDSESKSLIGYPQSVVEHFTKYMADNPEKRATFLAEIKDESQFSAKNGSAYIVKLPLLQFTINMGYDGTTISISGFSDQQMDSGQSAVVSPLLPCMYTVHAETASGSQTSEVECDMNEGNLKINIGVTN